MTVTTVKIFGAKAVGAGFFKACAAMPERRTA